MCVPSVHSVFSVNRANTGRPQTYTSSALSHIFLGPLSSTLTYYFIYQFCRGVAVNPARNQDMPHAIQEQEHTLPTPPSYRRPKEKSPKNREQQHLHALLASTQTLYSSSQFSQNLSHTLTSALKTAQTPITSILSLGLGSLYTSAKGQSRRLKQLAILLAIREELQKLSGAEISVYAQDPVFSRQDEAFLFSLNIRILRTPSASSLGEAFSLLSPSTLIFSPFLTLEAYEALFSADLLQLQLFVSDDFSALREKWPKYSEERMQVERLVKGAVGRYRRRAVSGKGFWEDEDQGFPMAVYIRDKRALERARM